MAEDEQRPAKRPRTLTCSVRDSEAESSPGFPGAAINIEHDREFWLEDGNIILVAQDIGFRVYKGLLAAQSCVFNDMFTAVSLSADEQYDGVPVVRLFDSPVDLRHLLRVLLPKNQKNVLKDKYKLRTEFHVMSALIRLSHKYQIEDVEKRSLSALCAIYPTVMEDWLEVDSKIDDEDRVFAIAAVNLARLTDTPTILPSAFYHCALLHSNVLRGFTREDGTKEYLCEEDLGRCMDGTTKLILSRTTTTLALAASIEAAGGHGCFSPRICALARRALSTVMARRPLYADAEAHAYGSESGRWTGAGLCVMCVKKLENEEYILLGRLWARLPSIFNVGALGDKWPSV